MSDRRPRGANDGDPEGSILPVFLWLALFAGLAWGLARLLSWISRALPLALPVAGGGRTLRWAREPISLVLALVLSLYLVGLASGWRRRRLGLELPADEEEPPEPAPEGPSPRDGLERQFARERRAERSGLRRGLLALDQGLAARALRRGGANDDLGCGGIVAILLLATVALPFAAEGIARAAGSEVPGQVGIFLWLALAYGGFVARALWKRLRRRA